MISNFFKQPKDTEVYFFMKLLHLVEEKNKQYSEDIVDKNIVYIFKNYQELSQYFYNNGVMISDDVIKVCIMKTTKQGNIIAMKALCDYTIRKYRAMYEDNNISFGRR